MKLEIAYLGPEGTYSNLVAEKRFGTGCRLIPCTAIYDVCRFVSKHPGRRGIIPIENSSGGAIYETVDVLLTNKPRIHVVEELALNVRLALMGHPGRKITTLYSHFVPMEHCIKWIRKHLPKVHRKAVSSTAIAAQKAGEEINSAALGNRKLAKIYGLKVLKYPVEADIPNITTFLHIAGRHVDLTGSNYKTTASIKLPNIPGSLCTLLEQFRNEDVNLSRLISRPIRGCPKEYAFLVDIEGHQKDPRVKASIVKAASVSDELRIVGSYPYRSAYNS